VLLYSETSVIVLTCSSAEVFDKLQKLWRPESCCSVPSLSQDSDVQPSSLHLLGTWDSFPLHIIVRGMELTSHIRVGYHRKEPKPILLCVFVVGRLIKYKGTGFYSPAR
jgi:hypothetical protein